MICNYCGGAGHLARVCFSKQGRPKTAQDSRPIRAVADSNPKDIWVNRLKLSVSHTNGSFDFRPFPDTGSAATLIAADLALQNHIRPTQPSRTKYINISGDPVPTTGTAPINLSASGRHINTSAMITPAIHNEIIVRQDDLKGLGVISKQFLAPIFIVPESCYSAMREDLIRNNPSVHTDELPEESMNTKCISMKIHLTPGEKMPFRISTARQVPLHWREKAESIINKLLDGKVITRQDDPTEWCAPGFFVANKNGDLRLVIDYTRLNKCVKQPVHTFPSAQEILSVIDPDSTVFAKLDATQGYHQVPLDENSSRLTTFLPPSGRFRFLPAPMGLSCSSDEFYHHSDKIIEGLPGIRKLVDDILVQAPDLKSLHNRINMHLERCKSNNFKLSRKKFEIRESVEFAGQIVSNNGVQPNPAYLQGIRDFPAPKTVAELHSFLGMVNQLSVYHPQIARHTGVLQSLLKKNTAFLWLEDQQVAFDRLKSDLISALALNHFNPSWNTSLVTDASRLHGLGFVLMQHNGDKTKVVQCGSRSLSPVEKNYSTLERKLTAIVWAIHKCDFFLKGIGKFEVVTDHRPLVSIFAKALPQIDNPRITRLREKISDRPFEVKWMAGKDNSTSYPVSSCIVAPGAAITTITDSCHSDPAYQQVVDAFRQGCRLSDLPVDHPAHRLKQVWDLVSITNNGILIVDGNRLYLPPGARADTLRRLHDGHCGYGKTLQTARALYFWPSMKHDIRVMIGKCEAC